VLLHLCRWPPLPSCPRIRISMVCAFSMAAFARALHVKTTSSLKSSPLPRVPLARWISAEPSGRSPCLAGATDFARGRWHLRSISEPDLLVRTPRAGRAVQCTPRPSSDAIRKIIDARDTQSRKSCVSHTSQGCSTTRLFSITSTIARRKGTKCYPSSRDSQPIAPAYP
jgi:hypothetical protein